MDSFGAHSATVFGGTPQLASDEVVDEGQRNDFLFKKVCRLRKAGLERDEILAALIMMNEQRCNPPLPDTELETIANSACKYEKGTVQEDVDEKSKSLPMFAEFDRVLKLLEQKNFDLTVRAYRVNGAEWRNFQ